MIRVQIPVAAPCDSLRRERFYKMKGERRQIAKERIAILLSQIAINPEKGERYTELIGLLCKRYNIPLPPEASGSICKRCFSLVSKCRCKKRANQKAFKPR